MASVSTVLRTDKVNKKNECPIHFRIIKDRKISYLASGFMIPVDMWDAEKNKVKSKHANSKRFNSTLSNRFAEIQDQVFEHDTNNKSVTSRQLRDKVFGKKPTDFFSFADTIVETYLTDGKIGSYDKNKAIIAKLKKFVKNTNIAFQDITPVFLTKYEKHLKVHHSNSINTIHKDLKFIRKLFNDAYRLDYIEHNIIPFNKFKLKTEKTQRIFLDEFELKRIDNLELTANSKICLHRDMFVFASYAGGLRVSDMLQLQWKHFDGTNINFTIKKTDNQLSIKVPNKGLEILNKYMPQKIDKNAYIFKMLPQNLNLDNPIDVDSAISSATAYINKNLKIIAEKAEITKPLSFHISRHTWATRASKKGLSLEKISKLMGHSSIKETQIYAKIVSSELDKAMDVFND